MSSGGYRPGSGRPRIDINDQPLPNTCQNLVTIANANVKALLNILWISITTLRLMHNVEIAQRLRHFLFYIVIWPKLRRRRSSKIASTRYAMIDLSRRSNRRGRCATT